MSNNLVIDYKLEKSNIEIICYLKLDFDEIHYDVMRIILNKYFEIDGILDLSTQTTNESFNIYIKTYNITNKIDDELIKFIIYDSLHQYFSLCSLNNSYNQFMKTLIIILNNSLNFIECQKIKSQKIINIIEQLYIQLSPDCDYCQRCKSMELERIDDPQFIKPTYYCLNCGQMQGLYIL